MTSLAEELRRYLIGHQYSFTPEERRNAHWVMSAEWFAECRRAEYPEVSAMFASTHFTTGPTYLLGMLVEVREDGGVPHLIVDE